MSDIETRLAAVERSVRRWRAGACCAGVALAAAVLIGAQRQREAAAVPHMLEARGIRILTADGRDVFSVASDDKGGASLLLRTGGGGTVMVNEGQNGPFIGMKGRQQKIAVRIGAADAGGQVRLYDDAEKTTFTAP